MKPALALLRRELMLALRSGAAGLAAPLFYLIGVSLFAFGGGGDRDILATQAPGILWVLLLLAGLLPLERLFGEDREDGSLDALRLSPLPLSGLVLVKAAGHWLTVALPLTLMTPLLAVMLGLTLSKAGQLALLMLPGSLSLSLYGAIIAALIAGLKRASGLGFLLGLPLLIPTLIFGTGASSAMLAGKDYAAAANLLIAISFFALALAPFAGAAALRLGDD